MTLYDFQPNPINYNHWLSLEYWTLEEAALLFCDIDPETFNEIHYSVRSKFILQKYRKTKRLLERYDFDPKDEKPNQVRVDALFDAAEDKGIRIPDRLKGPYELKNAPDRVLSWEPKESDDKTSRDINSSGYFNNSIVSAFDPLPTEGIARFFPLVPGSEENIRHWKKIASKASENGLTSARITRGSGSGQSMFNPVLVAEWLIEKGKFDAERAGRKLKGALARRDNDLAEELFPAISI